MRVEWDLVFSELVVVVAVIVVVVVIVIVVVVVVIVVVVGDWALMKCHLRGSQTRISRCIE